MRGLLSIACSLLCAIANAAPSQSEQAASHYRAGQAAYAEARYRDALHEFQIGYALAPRPEFLINFAQVHRKLGLLGDAEIDCERYLATRPPTAMAEEVSRLLAAIREERAAQRPAAVVEEPPPTVVRPSPPPPRRHRAALIGGLVAGGAVIVGVAVTLGVVLSRGPSYPSAQGSGDFR